MRKELNEEQLDQVVGGTVEFSGTKMKIGFTVLGKGFKVINCTSNEAMALIMQLYLENKDNGDLVFEQKTLEAFSQKGWIQQ